MSALIVHWCFILEHWSLCSVAFFFSFPEFWRFYSVIKWHWVESSIGGESVYQKYGSCLLLFSIVCFILYTCLYVLLLFLQLSRIWAFYSVIKWHWVESCIGGECEPDEYSCNLIINCSLRYGHILIINKILLCVFMFSWWFLYCDRWRKWVFMQWEKL